jgi:hypothetical protein
MGRRRSGANRGNKPTTYDFPIFNYIIKNPVQAQFENMVENDPGSLRLRVCHATMSATDMREPRGSEGRIDNEPVVGGVGI